MQKKTCAFKCHLNELTIRAARTDAVSLLNQDSQAKNILEVNFILNTRIVSRCWSDERSVRDGVHTVVNSTRCSLVFQDDMPWQRHSLEFDAALDRKPTKRVW